VIGKKANYHDIFGGKLHGKLCALGDMAIGESHFKVERTHRHPESPARAKPPPPEGLHH
jgi:hypothetical protein